ncbi:MAG TPA: YigZ family protein, partial [Firmicutes bacterium]|nr:YigZ family protein [Bacillota bacterium]
MGYRTVARPAEAEVIIKKSRFIGQVSPVASEEAAVAFVAEIKKKHREATHNCHAWIV